MIALFVGAAFAGDAAEAARLREELVRLAEKNSWGGVERTYAALLGLDVDLGATEHFLGGQAALTRGEVQLGWYRMRRAPVPTFSTTPDEVAAYTSASAEAASIETRFGKVALCVGAGRLPVLVRPEMPFAAIDKDAIGRVATQIREVGCYRGLLPVGKYELDGQPFEVQPGPGWVVQDVGGK